MRYEELDDTAKTFTKEFEEEAVRLVPVIDAILASDKDAPVKQRHTAQQIFERLRDEHGYTGGYTVVKDYVRPARLRLREAFVPLSHPPGHAQVDFGQCIGFIGGLRTVPWRCPSTGWIWRLVPSSSRA